MRKLFLPLMEKAGSGGSNGGTSGEADKSNGKKEESPSGGKEGDESSDETDDEEAEPVEGNVPLAAFNRLKNEAFGWKKELRKLQNEAKESKHKKASEAGEFKTLYEQEREEKEAALGDVETLRKGLTLEAKERSMREEAVKAGIRKEALDDLIHYIDDTVIAEAIDGRVKVSGAKALLAKLKKARPYLFDDGKVRQFNSGTGSEGDDKEKAKAKEKKDEELTPADLAKIRIKDPRKYREQRDKWFERRLSGKKAASEST